MRKRRFLLALLCLVLVALGYWRRQLDNGAAAPHQTERPPTSSPASLATAALVTRGGPTQPKLTAPQPLDLFTIMTNMKSRSATLVPNFQRFLHSLRQRSSKPVNLHVICDRDSKEYLMAYANSSMGETEPRILLVYHDATEAAEKVRDVITAMRPHFSSSSGSYYSDDLFFMSLGLHRVSSLDRVALVDLDTEFRADPAHLFQFFELFSEEHLFGLAPELSPVYKHVLYKFLHTLEANPIKIGEPDIEDGFSGYNSGIVLLDLERIRLSEDYESLLSPESVTELAEKYQFKGHLGDQDYFTLLGLERPELIFKLPCAWNRQLCRWWSLHGYADIFDRYFACEGKVKLYHGNCNSEIPEP